MSSSPTKQGEIMAMGVPVVCNEGVGDTDEIINKYKSGVVVKNFEYETAIKLMVQNNIDPLIIRKGAYEYFSLVNGVKKYATIYNSLIFQ